MSEFPYDVSVQHGTYTTYARGGCRCRPCKDAAAQHQREYRASKRPANGLTTFSTVPVGDWVERGACVGEDPDLFFPERGASTYWAKQICATCEVRSECLEYALSNAEKFGIWGGMSEKQRRKMRASRKAA